MKQILKACPLLVFSLLMSACQKVDFESNDSEILENEDKVTLKVNVNQYEQTDFESSRAVPIKNLCKRLSLGLYQDGKLVMKKNQYPNSPALGRLELQVVPGNYQLLVFAHNNDTTATITQPQEISFSPKKVTDTFINYQQVDVQENTTISVTLDRVVGMFRLCTEDNLPENVAAVSIKYTGGSSTLNAVSGYGCVKSRQEERFTMTNEMYGSPLQLDVYTFPRQDSQKLNVTINCLDDKENILYSRQLDDVPIAKKQITRCKLKLFVDDSGETPDTPEIGTNNDVTIEILAKDEWSTIDYKIVE